MFLIVFNLDRRIRMNGYFQPKRVSTPLTGDVLLCKDNPLTQGFPFRNALNKLQGRPTLRLGNDFA